MDHHMFGRKRSLFYDYGEQFEDYKKRHKENWIEGARSHNKHLVNCQRSLKNEGFLTRKTNLLTYSTRLSEHIASWADTQNSLNKVLKYFSSKQTTVCDFLVDSVNSKFLRFHQDITDECGAEDKQHAWGVIEKKEEIIMYGPYYPNYNSGEHSEDIIIKQTEEFLEAGDVSEDWKVYVFTTNSPCLARNTKPCMLALVHKALEWWSLYGVKTHIGFKKSWGFKGTKENFFKDINYCQVECINQSEDYENYRKRTEMIPELPLRESVFSAVKHLLDSQHKNFSLVTLGQKQDWKNYLKTLTTVFESKPEDEKKLLTQELNFVFEAAESQFSGKMESFEEYLEKGKTFIFGYIFNSSICDAVQVEMRVRFEQCWREMVEDKYAEFIKETLTDQFNQCTLHLFINDILQFTEEFLQIGKIQF